MKRYDYNYYQRLLGGKEYCVYSDKLPWYYRFTYTLFGYPRFKLRSYTKEEKEIILACCEDNWPHSYNHSFPKRYFELLII